MDDIDVFCKGLFDDDVELKKYKSLAPQELQDLEEDCKAKINVLIAELKHFIIKQHSIREDEMEMFSKSLNEAKSETDGVCIVKIHEFQREKKKASINIILDVIILTFTHFIDI